LRRQLYDLKKHEENMAKRKSAVALGNMEKCEGEGLFVRGYPETTELER